MKRQPVFEVWKNAAGEWQWHLKAGNGEIQAAGEGYKRRSGAIKGAETCRRNAAFADVVVLEATP